MTNESNIISRLYWIQYLKFITTIGYNYFKILNATGPSKMGINISVPQELL
jgi:hypothetical protein